MLSLTVEKLEQTRREIRERKDKRNVYVRDWREKQRAQKRKTVFVNQYVQAKFSKVYSEAINFYSALDQIYPDKKDLCRTTEFRSWRAKLSKKSTTDTRQSDQESTRNMVLNIPLIPCPSTMRPQPTTSTVETQPETTETTGEISTTSQLDNPSEIQQPLATPPEIGAEFTVEIPPIQPETPLETDEGITDRRIQEIIAELRDDPDLNGIFDDLQPNNQIDEGIEVPTFEQDLQTDIELMDQELEFSQW